MPIYEYACRACDHRFDKLVRTMSEPKSPECPKCGSKKTERALSVFAAVSSGGKSASGDSEMPSCGRCGGMPGSCGLD